ncbi:type II secretion system F family protein [archaeon]|nr:type II secretion system F family protein [archaeon]
MNNEFRKKKGLADEDYIWVSDKLKKKYVKELGLDYSDVKDFVKAKKSKKKVKAKSAQPITYKTNFYAKLSNFFMENLSFYFTRESKNFFDPLLKALTSANLRVLSKTYISMILFSTILVFPIALIVSFLLTFNVILSIFVGLVISGLVFALIYGYPFTIANDRRNKISQELVFAEVHMAAVAGSGAHPIKIFELLVDSGEYPALQEELKRVLNYLNIFGYSLSNALKAVTKTTPSPELKELFHGMISSIETGGDIRKYLTDKSTDTLTKYRFAQKKHLETVATYSEIYTGFLVAGPMLFIVTLAILEKVSPVLAGLSISTIATLGTFVLLPILNVFFILFLETMRSEI